MRINLKTQRIFRSLFCGLFFVASFSFAASKSPNIVYILADDLGYGDVSCLNPEGKIQTPHMDRIAKEGMRFTDAHSGSSVCSPTRYGILTGRYAWRSRLKNGVLGGLSPRLIEPDRVTVASFLKSRGYHTACIGKWHLGMDWAVLPGKEVSPLSVESREQVRNVDFTKPIRNGPNSVGFDFFFGISASLDMVPYAYIENDHVTAMPADDRDFPMVMGREKGRTRAGPAATGFDAANVLPDLTREAVDYIANRASDAKQGRPFFLYLPFASPHTPIMPIKKWQGKSGLNVYADFVMATDSAVGEILSTLEKHGLANDTIVIMTSDNGCSPFADYDELKEKRHNPSHVLRGHKADIFEGGHRVPFLVRWPNRIKPGSVYGQTICHTDLLATCADILNARIPDNAGEDSVSVLPALLGKSTPLRKGTVHHSANGSFAIREDRWKLILGPDSGGWSFPRPGRDKTEGLPAVQLYDLTADIGEGNNVQDKNPGVVKRLRKLLEKYVSEGRSTPGRSQKNAGVVDIWKKPAGTKRSNK